MSELMRAGLRAAMLFVFAAGLLACGDDDAPSRPGPGADDGGNAGTGGPDRDGGAGSGGGGTGGGGAGDGGPGAGSGAGDSGTDSGHAGHDAGDSGDPDVDGGGCDCPTPLNECTEATCSNGVCGEDHLASGVELEVQVAGNCRTAVCDGNGGITSENTDGDTEDDGNTCTIDTCNNGGVVHTPDVDAACNFDGGRFCDASADCVYCRDENDCNTNEVCDSGACVPEACMNGTMDPGETDTDCGGTMCNPCGPNEMCVVEEDCEGGDCNSGMTCEPNCADGVQNGDEAAVDCGVGCVTGCANTTPCDAHADCESGYCDATDDRCQTPECTDGVQNGDETDEDCGGGGLCDPCGPNQMCVLDSDCEGDDCNGSNVCEPNCSDGVRNNSEVDVDCGPGCSACGNGRECGADTHCISEICYEGLCIGSLNGCTPSTATDRTSMATVSIMISGFAYDPPCVRMSVGNTFQSEAAGIHPFVGGRILPGGVEAPASSGPLAGSTTASTPSFMMSTTGSFGFYCDNHGTTSGMMGAVFVVP